MFSCKKWLFLSAAGAVDDTEECKMGNTLNGYDETEGLGTALMIIAAVVALGLLLAGLGGFMPAGPDSGPVPAELPFGYVAPTASPYSPAYSLP